MRLNEARKLFSRLRKDAGNIHITNHSWVDYPERGFTKGEILNLVMHGKALLTENKGNNPTKDSFHFMPMDDFGVKCKLVIKFEVSSAKEWLIVISAYR